MKYCKDCKFFKPALKIKLQGHPKEIDYCFSRCTRAQDKKIPDKLTPVSGEFSSKADYFCDIERDAGTIEAFLLGKCGINARYFQQRELGDK